MHNFAVVLLEHRVVIHFIVLFFDLLKFSQFFYE